MMRKTLLVGLGCLLALGLLSTQVDAQTLRGVTRVDTANTGTAYDPVVYANNGRVFIAWSDNSTGGNGVYLSVSMDDGKTFGATMRIDSDPGDFRKDLTGKSIVATGDFVYIWWQDQRNDPTPGASPYIDDVYFVVSSDGGATFSAETRLDDSGTPGEFDAQYILMAAQNGNVFIAMLVNDVGGGTNDGIYVIASNDGGSSFSAAAFAGHGAPGDFDVDYIGLDCFGISNYWPGVEYAFVAFDDNSGGNDDLYGCQFSNTGALSPIARVDMDTTGLGDVEGSIVVGIPKNVGPPYPPAPTVHVAWLEERIGASNEEVRYNNSADGGLTFAAVDQLIGGYTAGTDDVDYTFGDCSGSDLLLAWEDNRTGVDEIYVAVSHDDGASWNADAWVTDPATGYAGGGAYPRLFMAGDAAAVAWSGPAFPEDAWVSWSRDAGENFGAPINMSASTGDVDYVELCVDGTYPTCHAVFLDDPLAVNNVYTNSFRGATLTLVGDYVSGNPHYFHFEGGLDSESGGGAQCAVVLSWSLGNYIIGDGRNVYIDFDVLFQWSLGAGSAFLRGPLAVDGSGDTPTVNIGLAPGTTLYAVGGALPGGSVGSLTDPIEITIQ